MSVPNSSRERVQDENFDSENALINPEKKNKIDIEKKKVKLRYIEADEYILDY